MNMNINTDTLLNEAKKLSARNSNPEPLSEWYAKKALENDQKTFFDEHNFYETYRDMCLIQMTRSIEIENNRERLLRKAKELTSQYQERKTQFPTTEPSESEHFAKEAIKHQTDRPYSDNYLINMKQTLESEKQLEKQLKLAKEISLQKSTTKLNSEKHAVKALEHHEIREHDACQYHLTKMKISLKQEKNKLNNNPGPDQPTLQALREKRKEETLKEQEAQPQIKRKRSR